MRNVSWWMKASMYSMDLICSCITRSALHLPNSVSCQYLAIRIRMISFVAVPISSLTGSIEGEDSFRRAVTGNT
jgi:hypothetical protein